MHATEWRFKFRPQVLVGIWERIYTASSAVKMSNRDAEITVGVIAMVAVAVAVYMYLNPGGHYFPPGPTTGSFAGFNNLWSLNTQRLNP